MDTNTQNLIKEKMDSLPPEFKKALASIEWGKIVQEIGKKNNIHVDKIGDLQTETMMLLMGVTHPGDYQAEVEKALGLPEGGGVGILNDINEKILLPIRKKVMEATGEKEEVEAKSSEAGSPDAYQEASGEDKATIETLRRLDKMPDEINKLIGDPALPAKISNAGKLATMDEKQLSDLEDMLSMVLLGYVHPDRLGVEIKSKFNYTDAQTGLVVDSINKEIFNPIRNVLIKNYDDLLKEIGSQGVVLKAAGVEVLGATEGAVGSKEGVGPQSSPGVQPLGINLAAQKLSASFRMPKQETDLSLIKPTAPAVTPAPVAPVLPKIDPYKEKI